MTERANRRSQVRASVFRSGSRCFDRIAIVAMMLLIVVVSLRVNPAWGVLAKLSDDVYVELGPPATAKNFGSDPALRVQGYYGRPEQRTFIKFDLSTVPTRDPNEVRSAILTLFVNQVARPGGMYVAAVSDTGSAWTEATINGQSAPAPAATATNCTKYPLPKAITAAEQGTFISVDVTCIVQDWIRTPSSNVGFALKNGTRTVSVAFDSKEATGTSHPPALEVTVAGGAAPAVKPPEAK